MQDQKAKDVSAAFTKKLTNFKQRPGENSRYLIRRNLKQLVENVCRDSLEFTYAANIKAKALSQLKNIIVLAENEIQQYVDQILRSLVRLLHKEDKNVDQQITNVCELLGIYSGTEFYIPVVANILNEEESKSSSRLASNLLEVSGFLICNETMDSIESDMKQIITIIESVENTHNENPEVMIAGFNLVANLIYVAREHCSRYRSQIFSYLLTLQSIPMAAAQIKDKTEMSMEFLARNSGCKDIKELYSIEVSSILNGFYESRVYKTWDRNSKDRYKFDILVRNCGRGLSDFLPIILEILEALVSQETDLETRIDALSLVEFLITLDEMVEQLRLHSLTLMSKVLIPCAVWRAGKPLIKIRKASIVCMIKLIERQIISEENLQQCVNDLKPVLKSCLNDDWAPDLRFTSCVLLEHLFSHLRESLTDMDLSDLYPHLLERLDDSQDMIRIEITRSIHSFFNCTNLKMSPGTFEYVVRNILIHLDDQNENLQIALFKVLQTAAQVKPKIVLKEAKVSLSKQKYPRFCQELIRSIEEGMDEETKNADDSD